MALVHQREICSSESGSESNGSPLIRERIRIQRQSAHQGADQHRSVFCSSGSGQRRPSQRRAGASGASRNLPSLRQTVVPQLRQTVAPPLRQTVVSNSSRTVESSKSRKKRHRPCGRQLPLSERIGKDVLRQPVDLFTGAPSAIADERSPLGQERIKGVCLGLLSRSHRPPCGYDRTSGSSVRDRSLLSGRQSKFTQRLGAGCLSCGEADSPVDLDQRRRLISGHHNRDNKPKQTPFIRFWPNRNGSSDIADGAPVNKSTGCRKMLLPISHNSRNCLPQRTMAFLP